MPWKFVDIPHVVKFAERFFCFILYFDAIPLEIPRNALHQNLISLFRRAICFEQLFSFDFRAT